MKAMSNRQARVAEGIKSVISPMLIHELGDPRLQFITITGVEVTADLRIANVYFMLRDSSLKDKALDGLESAAPSFRRRIAGTLKLRYTPELKFFYDESYEKGERIESLLVGLKGIE